MTSQTIEKESYAEVRHPELLPNGGIYWVKIELRQQNNGLLFVSPVNGAQHLVEDVTIANLDTEWWQEDYGSDILDGIASMGGGRWVLGDSTEYDLIEEDEKYYLQVTEIMRGDLDEFLKEIQEGEGND